MVAAILGGVGLFLLGMVLLTDGLRALAGDSLRRVLGRFAGGPLSAFLSGAGLTALVQSSSATTVATIGFVSAGLLTLPQALGVIVGANVGTTSTGWLVSLLGLKLSVGVLAMPLVGGGALLRVLARGRAAKVGLAVAGFGLIFVGIEALEGGMQGLAEKMTPAVLPDDTLPGRLALVGLGAAMTILLQSSSAAVALTLTALHAGTIALPQAAALVIGQNLGTTTTAVIASAGGSVPAKRTALSHVFFNLVTGVIAFALLPVFVRIASAAAARIGGEPGPTSLAAFHTGFNLLGAALFLPVTGPFAKLITRLVKERGPALTRNLEPSAASIPAVAVEVARRTVLEIAGVVISALGRLLCGGWGDERTDRDLGAAESALAETRRYLATVRSGRDQIVVRDRHLSILHAIDHAGRLIDACREERPARTLASDEELRKAARALSRELESTIGSLEGHSPEAPAARAERVSRSIADIRRAHRPALLARTAAGEVDPDTAERQLEAMRWVDRLAYHTWRVVAHLAEPPPREPPEQAPAARGDIGAGAPR